MILFFIIRQELDFIFNWKSVEKFLPIVVSLYVRFEFVFRMLSVNFAVFMSFFYLFVV